MSLNLIPDNITLRKMSEVNNAYWSKVCQCCLKAGDKGRWWWFLFASLTSCARMKGEGAHLCSLALKKLAPSNLSGCFPQLCEVQCLAAGFILGKECHLAYVGGSRMWIPLLLDVWGLKWFASDWTFSRLLRWTYN